MKQQFGLIKRPWGVFDLKNKTTGEQTSLKTRDKVEAQRLLQAENEAQSQPHFNLALARVYINGADPKLGTRTWQEDLCEICERRRATTYMVLRDGERTVPGAKRCRGGFGIGAGF